MFKAILCFAALICLLNTGHSQCLTLGGDLSYVNSVMANGGVYRDTSGNNVDPYALFATRGANLVRIRLWHTPENITDHCGNPISTNNLDDVVLAFQRAKAQGMQLKLAIHYGDYFNDPGKQKMPLAWEGLPFATLLDSIYNYTYFVLAKLESEGLRPDIVAIGNETTNGFIDATATTNGWSWPEDADKFNIALLAVDDFNQQHNATIKKALHFTDSTAEWLAGLFQNQNITNYDIIGISYYPVWTELSLKEIGDLINHLKNTYNKEIMVFETGAPWTTASADNYSNIMNSFGMLDYPTTPAGQKDFLIELATVVHQNGGTGLLYWEPGWVTSGLCDKWGQGSSYENVSFFDFENGNSALPAFDVFDFCNNLGADEGVVQSENILVFPNPVTSEFEIRGLKNFTEIHVINCLGSMVRKISGYHHQINLYDLPDGVYFLSIYFDDGVITKRIIKQGY